MSKISESRVSKKQRLYTALMVVQSALVFCIIFLVATVYANWQAISVQLAYRPTTPTATPTPAVTTTPTPTPKPAPVKQIIESPHIVISKIGVDVPISWQVPAENTIDYLNRGVAHLAGRATLGQVGNLFITGHSSDYTWHNNPYAAVFALLPKLQVGDTIEIKENGKSFVYAVNQTKVVDPNNVEVAQPTTSAVLTLMTCYPIGSTKERYIVHASLVSSPDQLTPGSQASQALPEIKFR